MPSKGATVAYLGPPGSFTHEAAQSKLGRFELVEKETLEDVFDSVFVDETDYGVLPVENSTHGIVALTYHKLVEQGLTPSIKIWGEIYHPVSHALGAVAQVPLDSVKFVHTKEEAWDQCRNWTARNLPRDVTFVPESSTSRGAQYVASKKEPNRVAIASPLALELNELNTIASAIQDFRSNSTRFFVVSKRSPRRSSRPGKWKATLAIVLLDRIGAVADAFKVFADTHVDVRSVKVSPVRAPEAVHWKDWFFVDVSVPADELARITQALELLRDSEGLVLTVRELGRYPSSEPHDGSRRQRSATRTLSLPGGFGDRGKLSLADLIAAGEGAHVEFKSTLRWNLKESRVDKEIESSVLRTIVGFMNSFSGGILLIGVQDDGEIIGIKEDYQTLRKASNDAFELHLRNVLQGHIGSALLHLVTIRFLRAEDKYVCVVAVDPSPSPVWLQKEGRNEFHVRSGNQTRRFDTRETADYVRLRWSS